MSYILTVLLVDCLRVSRESLKIIIYSLCLVGQLKLRTGNILIGEVAGGLFMFLGGAFCLYCSPSIHVQNMKYARSVAPGPAFD